MCASHEDLAARLSVLAREMQSVATLMQELASESGDRPIFAARLRRRAGEFAGAAETAEAVARDLTGKPAP